MIRVYGLRALVQTKAFTFPMKTLALFSYTATDALPLLAKKSRRERERERETETETEMRKERSNRGRADKSHTNIDE